MNKQYEWEFPLPRTHTGMLQANGLMGIMIWGEGSILRVTVGRVDFWDHRGGMSITKKQSYANIRKCLETKDVEGMRELFSNQSQEAGEPRAPSVLPIGRIELDFGTTAHLVKGVLDVSNGTVIVDLRKNGKDKRITFTLDMESPLLAITFPRDVTPVEIRRVTAWEYVGEYLESVSFKPPKMIDASTMTGWMQECPSDPALCLAYHQADLTMFLTTARGAKGTAAKNAATKALSQAEKEGVSSLQSRARTWWTKYWEDVPEINIPNERLSFLYHYGMYKFAGLTHPEGIAATLQGAWVEEYQMPPWCNDYHFNINVQMCYWPAYRGNRVSHLNPLWKMIQSWTPLLRENAKNFVGVQDGRMLPHAVDDRGTCMGGFWTGNVDHGCTAWVAEMMYRHYRYTMDKTFLRKVAYPFMKGAMAVYEKMLERKDNAFVLPVSVSPEYRGAEMNAWGRNASFQLACIHRLCEDLMTATEALHEEPKPIWKEIHEKLPKACISSEGEPRIMLWEGTPLEESHRHHSHLASICPFDVVDPSDPEWKQVAANSLWDWLYHGMGLWSGWCVPWAAMINLRFGNADAAELMLEIWERVYTNQGHGTLHDYDFPGFCLMGGREPEIMQMDAGMSSTAAIQEMMLHTRRGVNYLFGGAPKRWKEVSFGPMRTDGAFLVSAERKNGEVKSVKVESEAGGLFRIANPWKGTVNVKRTHGKKESVSGDVLEIETIRGEKIELRR